MESDWYRRLQSVLAGPAGVVAPLLVVLPLALSSASFNEITGTGSGATLQKLAVVVSTLIVALLLGIRVPPLPVWLLAGAVAAAYIVGLITGARGISGFDADMLFGAAGLIYPWLVFFIDWRKLAPFWRTLPLAVAPLLAIVVSSVAELTGALDLTLIRQEYTGAARLSAGMPPAFLAGLSLMAVGASMLIWATKHWIGFYLAVINVAIVALTGTRMATAAAGLVFVCMLVVGVVRRYPHWIAGLVVTVVAAVGGGVYIIPNFLQRIAGASGGGTLQGSGRELAWAYFFQRFLERPLTGFGPGSGPLLAEQAGSHVVRDFFVSPHNTYLTMAVDLGAILGLVFFGALIWLFVVIWRRLGRDLRWLMLVFAIATLIYAGFDNLLTAPQSAVAFCVFLALMWSSAGDQAATASESDDGVAPSEAPAHRPAAASPRREYRARKPRRMNASGDHTAPQPRESSVPYGGFRNGPLVAAS